MTAPIDLEAPWPNGEIRLWDSQWMNIVNGDCASPVLDREDAIALAIKLTEKAMRKNYEAELTTRRARDAEVVELVDAAAFALRTRDDAGALGDTAEFNLRAALAPFTGAKT